MRLVYLAAFTALVFATPVFAQGGGTASNSVGLWGQTDAGTPCLVAPSPSGSSACALPTVTAAPALAPADAVIANGGSLSNAVEIDGRLNAIVIPAAWTTAAITFSASADGSNYHDVVDIVSGSRTERTLASGAITAGDFVALTRSDWAGMKYLKVRSGTSASPVNQGAARTFSLIEGG